MHFNSRKEVEVVVRLMAQLLIDKIEVQSGIWKAVSYRHTGATALEYKIN
jgi:hypothetical protein